MKIRKRYLLLIMLSLLPFYKIIHFDDYCINDVDYLLIAFLSIIVLVVFLAIVFFNLYQISIGRELFNYRPLLIIGVFLPTLYIGLKFPDIVLLKLPKQQFQHQIDSKTTAKIVLFNDNTFLFKFKASKETCTNHGTYLLKKDSLFLKLNNSFKQQTILDSLYVFDKTKKKLQSTAPKYPNFSKQ